MPRQARRHRPVRDRSLEGPREYHVYVIEETSHGRKKLYVGQSGKTPELRLKEHRARCKRYCSTCRCRSYTGPAAHGLKLRYDLFSRYNPVDTRAEAETIERWLARRLTQQGYDVIGGH